MSDAALRAIIDIGSNSVRLVVYGPPLRAPAVIFNEKVSAALGAHLAETGQLDMAAMLATVQALERFALLTREMGCTQVRTVATAAVRDAANGRHFIDMASQTGLAIEVLSGDEEAEGAGWGVISAVPDADGIVGDLGGGSLELVRVKDGRPGERLSLPLGVLRLAAIREKRGQLDRVVVKALRKAGWPIAAEGLPLYLVGGSWRALARVHMSLTDYPLRVLHHYAMPPLASGRLVRVLAQVHRKRLRAIEGMPQGRVPALADAAALLAILSRALKSSALVVSAAGLREGLLFRDLSPAQRAEDPLAAGVRQSAVRQVRFDQHGDLLAKWIAPVFADDSVADARLRNVACLLGDIAWAANPDFRAERGVDVALHGNWTGVDARGRALMAQALYTSFGGGGVASLASLLAAPADLERAIRWGFAMRLGQRLSGGVAGPLRRSRLAVDGGALRLDIDADAQALYGDVVERRLRQLAAALDLTPQRT
ncbi:MAG: Ppx/GppA family phosphatase [Sphingomonadaceae bacterium]